MSARAAETSRRAGTSGPQARPIRSARSSGEGVGALGREGAAVMGEDLAAEAVGERVGVRPLAGVELQHARLRLSGVGSRIGRGVGSCAPGNPAEHGLAWHGGVVTASQKFNSQAAGARNRS